MADKLVYIKKVSTNNDGTFAYKFYFSDEPENVWGQDWDVINPQSCTDLEPEESTYSEVLTLSTSLPLKTAQETNYLPMEYVIYRILAIAWIDIENMETYPEHGRMVFHFGDTKEKVTELLNLYELKFDE